MMDNQQLYDLMTRIAILIEGVKRKRDPVLVALIASVKEEVRTAISHIRHKKMGDMTKIELNRLLAIIQAAQAKEYNYFIGAFLEFLLQFMTVDVLLMKRVFTAVLVLQGKLATDEQADAFFDVETESRSGLFGPASILGVGGFDLLWSKIINAPMPANGMFIKQFLAAFAQSAQSSVLNAIRAAYANNDDVLAALDSIVGTDNAPGVLDRSLLQSKAVSDTILQHVAAIVSAAVTSTLMDEYVWISVMDSHTTEICRSRNDKRYRYGEGPLPPAHIKCRSHTMPVSNSNGDIPNPSLYNWASSQPALFQKLAFGADNVQSLSVETRRNLVTAIQPISLAQFSKADKFVV